MVNNKTNDKDQYKIRLFVTLAPKTVANQLKILIPVGTAITIVAALKYALV